MHISIRPNNHAGFSVILVVLLLAFVGSTGVAGWALYRNQPNVSLNVTPAHEDAQTAYDAGRTKSVPEGYVSYTAEIQKVNFAYPQSWGDASMHLGPESDHLESGREVIIKFSANPVVTAAMRSKDWKHDQNKGHDGVFYAGLYTDVTKENREHKLGSGNINIGTPDASVLVGAPFGGLGCNGVGELLVHPLRNEKYQSIVFLYIEKTPGDIQSTFNKETNTWSNGDPQAICDKGQFKKYISSDRINQLLKINKTIIEL